MTLYLTYLEIMFGEGAKWPVPTTTSYTQFVVFITFLVAATFLVRLYYSNKMKRIHQEQFFISKIMQRGLTEYQSKMVQEMVRISGLKNPEFLLKDETLFENAVARYLTYIRSRDESKENLSSIFHDIVITYEKIFHHTSYKKPLDKLYDVEINILLCFFTESKEPYIVKLRQINKDFMNLKLLRGGNKLTGLTGKPLSFYFWRAGDAEYTFTGTVKKVENNFVELFVPSEFTRGKEVFHPYVNVFIPCEIMIDVPGKKADEDVDEKTDLIAGEKAEEPAEAETPPEMDQNELIDKILAEEDAAKHPWKKIIATTETRPDAVANIIKINEHEAVLRFETTIDYKKAYVMSFHIGDFHYKIKASPVSDKIIERERLYNYTMRFSEISDNALRVLRNFMSENVHGYDSNQYLK